eukprot:CAMPEP_0113553868 /NCGR_PEP_ID=MMETSP0015_2-20120614/15842_1 /TAXON_ID=2838 /ORGANISM="Odontella" /LENGTH=602 /DNA_ID=CAMNT_0000454965 /DNA_START=12 /DNA_END=1820 /DNA_ORIENTATION=- /assembly_acc=CAM_ASM_000160
MTSSGSSTTTSAPEIDSRRQAMATAQTLHVPRDDSPRDERSMNGRRGGRRRGSGLAPSTPRPLHLFALCVLLLLRPLSPSPLASAAASGSIPRSTSHRLSLSDPEWDDAGSDAEGDESRDESSSVASSTPQRPRRSDRLVRNPPWNRSPRIDADGFLADSYRRIPGEWEPEADIGGRHGPSSRSYRFLQSGTAPPAVVRQVPGDGNCLFHSVSATLAHRSGSSGGGKGAGGGGGGGGGGSIVDGEHPPLCTARGLRTLRKSSADLRRRAVECLSKYPRRRLFLQGRETLRAGELVDAAAAQYGLSGEEYCEQMARDSYWGGGPEIVALCNVLRRPIHVYELCSVEEGDDSTASSAAAAAASSSDGSPSSSSSTEDAGPRCAGDESPELYSDASFGRAGNKDASPPPRRRTVHPQFRLRRMACFGSPRYDRREPLHILSADSRFPDVTPGRQLPTGNHFLAMFPEEPPARGNKRRRKNADATRRPRKVRGGAGGKAAAAAKAKARGRGINAAPARDDAPHRHRRQRRGRGKPAVAPRDDMEGNFFGRIGRWVNRMDRSGGGANAGGPKSGSPNDINEGGPFGGLAASLMERWMDLLGRFLSVI